MILELSMFAAFVVIGILRLHRPTRADGSAGAPHALCGFDDRESLVLTDPDGTPVP